MGGLTSRNKGKRGEREVIDLLQPIVDTVMAERGYESIILQRNTLQSDRGGSDIANLPWLAVEVKYQEASAINEWWRQCTRQAQEHQTPVLIHRCNNAPWKVRMYGGLGHEGVWSDAVVDVSIDSFKVWFRLKLISELEG